MRRALRKLAALMLSVCPLVLACGGASYAEAVRDGARLSIELLCASEASSPEELEACRLAAPLIERALVRQGARLHR